MAERGEHGRRSSQRRTDEEKAAAVRRVLEVRAERGRDRGAIVAVARELDLPVESLRRWVRQTERGDPPRVRLTREQIVDAALDLVDAEGLDGLSMRALAQRLGVAPMSLYAHFDSKLRLERALARRVTSGVLPSEEMRAEAEPGARMLWTAQRVRLAVLEHPALAPLVARFPRPLPGDDSSSLFDVQLAVTAAREDGWSDDDIPLLLGAVVEFTLGFLLYETGRMPNGPMADNPEALRALLGDLESAGADDLGHQVLAAFLPERSGEIFEAGFTAMYEGLRARYCR